jgi:hypothetical protein
MKTNGGPFSCNICGDSKGVADDWSVLTLGTVTLQDDSAAGPSELRELKVSEWHPILANTKGAAHACGNNCTQKLVERYLQNKSFDAPRAASISVNGGAA